jgi:hypothetical protein
MKHLRGYVFKQGTAIPIEMDFESAEVAHQVIGAAFPNYMFLIEREVEEDE